MSSVPTSGVVARSAYLDKLPPPGWITAVPGTTKQNLILLNTFGSLFCFWLIGSLLPTPKMVLFCLTQFGQECFRTFPLWLQCFWFIADRAKRRPKGPLQHEHDQGVRGQHHGDCSEDGGGFSHHRGSCVDTWATCPTPFAPLVAQTRGGRRLSASTSNSFYTTLFYEFGPFSFEFKSMYNNLIDI